MTTSRSFVLICTVGIFCFISYNMVRMPALSLFAESLGASPERIGLIVSVSTLTGVFLKLPSGALSDIYGRRFLLRIGVVAFGLPPFLYPFITNLDALTALRFLHGFATAIFAPSALATVAELYRERRGAALGTYTACTQPSPVPSSAAPRRQDEGYRTTPWRCSRKRRLQQTQWKILPHG